LVIKKDIFLDRQIGHCSWWFIAH